MNAASVITLVLGLVCGVALTAAAVQWRMRRAKRLEAERFERIRVVARTVVRARREMSREREIPDLYRTACRILFEGGLASVAMIINNGYGVLRIVQINGRTTSFSNDAFDWPDPGSDIGSDDPCIRCLRTGEVQLCSDLQLAARMPDEAPAGWAAGPLKVGLRTQIALPVERNGRVFTILSLFADEPGVFDGSVCEVLQAFAIDLAQSIARIEQESVLRDAAVKAENRADQIGSLFDAIPISMLMLSVPEGRIVYVNNLICERAAMPRKELIGKMMRELPFGLLEEDRKKALGMLATEGRVSNLELMHRMRNGEIAPVLVNIEYVQYLGQLCVLVNTTDIRELREAQKAEQAKLAAEAASRAKTEFLTRLGHELRNPLNAVIGFTQLLRDEAMPRLAPKDVIRLDNIIQAGWHLLSLTNDILDLSNIELGRVAVTTSSLQLAPELDFALAISGQLAIGNEVKLHGDYDSAEGLTVLADQVRFRQVMLNLLSNAIKYNRRGGKVWVRVQADDSEVHVDVVDNGLGMTREQLKQLFEPYNRLGREQEGVEGLGVGLAVSRELLRLMNGRLEAESRPSTGTRFRVTLPRGAAAAPITAFMPPGSEVKSSTVGGLVLYVEDSPINALLVEQLLSNFSGVRFVHAENGTAGLELIESLSPDLVLLDMQLPDMDGFDVLQKLRRRGLSVTPRIVALSGSAMPEEVERALNMGAVDYWTKPLVADRFLASVSKILA